MPDNCAGTLNCPITLSNYKHEKYTVLLELKEANLHY